jgi:hypothetical protein
MRGCRQGGDGDGKAEARHGLEHGASQLRAQRTVGLLQKTQNPMIAGIVVIGLNYSHRVFSCLDIELICE